MILLSLNSKFVSLLGSPLLTREMQRRMLRSEICRLRRLRQRFDQNFRFSSSDLDNVAPLCDANDPLYVDVPKPAKDKSERKPYPTPMKELIRKAKKEKELGKLQPCRLLQDPPSNGLLVPELVGVAHRVYHARESLLSGVSKLIRLIPVQRCSFCTEVHIGHVGHEIRSCTGPESGFRSATHVWRKGGVRDVIFFPKCYHLDDRVGKPRVTHDEMHIVRRIPAIVELSIQAGLDIEKYPTKRRTKPVYSIEGRIVDFESMEPQSGIDTALHDSSKEKVDSGSTMVEHMENSVQLLKYDGLDQTEDREKMREIGMRTMDSWFELVSGAKKIMEKYSVWTCGYCPEVQVGPKGHKVRMCKASKHQSRSGLHAWQEATIDDLVGPNYVWHVRDPNGLPLQNELKRYYGKAPAVVELCVQAGAPVPDQYRGMMRLDVVSPERDEVDLVT